MSKSQSFTVRGHKVRTSSNRRFVVWAGRTHPFEGRRWDYRIQDYVSETYGPVKPWIVRRSDDYDTARKAAEKTRMPGGFVAIVDTATGHEVEGPFATPVPA